MNAGAAARTPRRIVVIHTDAQAHDFLECGGYPGFRTPNLSRLAARGTRFTRAYACNGVCVPSRASLMTGRYPIAHGVMNNHMNLHPDEPRMGRLFADAGFATGYFGKTHFGNNNADMAGEGWSESFLVSDYNRHLAVHGCGVRYPEKSLSHPLGLRYWQAGPSDIPEELYFENVLAGCALDFVSRHRDRDFLCFLSMVAPHGPFSPPERFLRMFRPGDIPLRPRSAEELQGKPPAFQRWIRQNQAYLNPAELEVFLAVMASLLALVDEQMGRILDGLESLGILEDTWIVFTSDHGDFSSAYGAIGKSWCMDDLLMRIPLIVSGPGVHPGSRLEAHVQNCDILPFLLDAAGEPRPQRMQGKSLLPLLRNPSERGREAVFACQSNEYSADRLVQSMVVHDGWKYVESFPAHPQLFDLANDPMEWVNLAGSPRCRERQEDLRDRLLQWHLGAAGGFFHPETAGFWEDETGFYNPAVFTGERIRAAGPGIRTVESRY